MNREGPAGQRTASLTVEAALKLGRRTLSAHSKSHAEHEAAYLLSGVLAINAGQLQLNSDEVLDDAALREFEARLERRSRGEPLQYIEARAAFRDLTLKVDRSVLIPRPETEQLVERVLEWSSGKKSLSFLDIGTGSGAIALSLLKEGPFRSGVGVDISADALELAAQNAFETGIGPRLDLRVGAFLTALRPDERFHVIVSNPPYVALDEAASLPSEVRDWEPHEALFAGPTGLEAIERIVGAAPAHLEPGGLLALEIAPDLAEATVRCVRERGALGEPRVSLDLARRVRFILAVAGGR